MAIYKHNKTYEEFKPDLSKSELEQEVVRVKEIIDNNQQTAYTKEVFPGDNLQNIINSMSYGGVVVLRNGSHNIGSNNLVVKNGVSLVGESAYGVVITGSTGVRIETYPDGSYATTTNVTIQHGDNTLSIPGTTNYVDKYILLDGLYYRLVEKLTNGQYRLEFPYVGSDLNNASVTIYPIYSSIKLHNLTLDGVTISAYYTSELFISDILFKNAQEGIDALNVSNMSIDKCDFVDVGTAVRLNNVHYSEIMSTGAINIGVDAFYINNSSHITTRGLFTSSVANTSVNINSSQSIKVDGSFQYSGTGINMSSSTDISLNSSLLSFNTTAVNISGSSRNTISNCSLINNQTAINIANSGSNDNIISSNIFSNNTTGLADNGTNTLVRSNIGVADN